MTFFNIVEIGTSWFLKRIRLPSWLWGTIYANKNPITNCDPSRGSSASELYNFSTSICTIWNTYMNVPSFPLWQLKPDQVALLLVDHQQFVQERKSLGSSFAWAKSSFRISNISFLFFCDPKNKNGRFAQLEIRRSIIAQVKRGEVSPPNSTYE